MMNEQATAPAPWWRHGLVWMLVAGPAAVVVAGIATIWIAARGADPVVAPDYYRRGIEINQQLAARDKALLPAQQGRNHAATPARP
ncbi:MAG TPA: FixH family protein [Ramlibacter sp.]|nr:FixH family protein [Ramlibacter sp.]